MGRVLPDVLVETEVRMYAIIETGGKQFRVQEGNKIVVDNLAA